jgi:hypothetical protein
MGQTRREFCVSREKYITRFSFCIVILANVQYRRCNVGLQTKYFHSEWKFAYVVIAHGSHATLSALVRPEA